MDEKNTGSADAGSAPRSFASTDNRRTQNSGNDVRSQYRALSDGEKAQITNLKSLGQQFIDLCDQIGAETTVGGSSRELAIAKTNAEQAVMWAVKHVTK